MTNISEIARRAAIGALMIGLIGCVTPAQAQAQDKPLLVFAAASLKNALDDADAAWARKSGQTATASYGASSTLAKQIEAGAPADVFISADLDWMDYLAKKNLIRPATRKNLLNNDLVLVAPKGTASVKIEPNFPLASLLKGGRLAVADTASVPAGKYAKASLEKHGVRPTVEKSLAPAENVRAAQLLVSRREAPYGIVYRTDVAAAPDLAVAGVFPEDSHPPIIYPIALLASAKNPNAAAYVAFLESAAAKPAFTKQGFNVIVK
jgi:molybdate transport system substrate-binding protein